MTTETENGFAVKTTVDITWDRVCCLLCSALEGGSNYWYTIDEFLTPTEIEPSIKEEWGDYKHLAFPCSPYGAIIIEDQEDEDVSPRRTALNRQVLMTGMQNFATTQSNHFRDFLNENDDAVTGDVFLQVCLFGKVIYG